ncbi:MAG TPA: hypothetical protein DEQ80_11805 [Anaerolinea thermolimosa]|uniref:Uncharacterized protein n=1 Tax=Anaerolinea thermolimosa TaxID=229919 RepID=A0A3D1JJB1_9CHLR|nr:hypothetical protein [Anaerolinea thermolimosa]
MSEIVNEVRDFIQIEHYHSRLKRYLREGKELLKQVLPKEEAELVSSLLGYTLLSALWNSEGYGPAVTQNWIKRETISLKRQINRVRRKHS